MPTPAPANPPVARTGPQRLRPGIAVGLPLTPAPASVAPTGPTTIIPSNNRSLIARGLGATAAQVQA